jgi:hypothetical protein
MEQFLVNSSKSIGQVGILLKEPKSNNRLKYVILHKVILLEFGNCTSDSSSCFGCSIILDLYILGRDWL